MEEGAHIMTDPAAIDLEPYKQRRAERYPDEDGPYDGPIEDSDDDIDDLIAAVEALRECVAAYETQIEEIDNSWAANLQELKTAEAQVVELAEALKWALPLASLELENVRQVRLQAGHSDIGRGTKRIGLWPKEQEAECHARAALASTPAAVLERARAKDDVVKALREPWEYDGPVGVLEALAKLDALD